MQYSGTLRMLQGKAMIKTGFGECRKKFRNLKKNRWEVVPNLDVIKVYEVILNSVDMKFKIY